jgi:hypothetical protein
MIMRSETTTAPAVKPSFGAEFQPFLYGLVGDDPSGMPLSILSVLARQNLDPWEQAGNWSRLPRQAATGELVAVIASLPPGLTSRPAPERIAERLIALLPSPRGLGSLGLGSLGMGSKGERPLSVGSGGPGDHKGGNTLSTILFYVSFLLLGQWVVMGLRASMSSDKPSAPSIQAAAPVHPDRPDLQ